MSASDEIIQPPKLIISHHVELSHSNKLSVDLRLCGLFHLTELGLLRRDLVLNQLEDESAFALKFFSVETQVLHIYLIVRLSFISGSFILV